MREQEKGRERSGDRGERERSYRVVERGKKRERENRSKGKEGRGRERKEE